MAWWKCICNPIPLYQYSEKLILSVATPLSPFFLFIYQCEVNLVPPSPQPPLHPPPPPPPSPPQPLPPLNPLCHCMCPSPSLSLSSLFFYHPLPLSLSLSLSFPSLHSPLSLSLSLHFPPILVLSLSHFIICTSFPLSHFLYLFCLSLSYPFH